MDNEGRKYLLLPNPGHNRVYFEAAKDISMSELRVILPGVQVEAVEIANIQYMRIDSALPLNKDELGKIARLSSFYALYELRGDGSLIPVDCGEWRYFPDSLNTILKYSGKTNEQFTRLMINIAAAVCESSEKGKGEGEPLHLFDPMAGKGTTLFEGIIHGYNVTGMDIAKYEEECAGYFVKFLENGRYKHKASKESRGDSHGRKLASLSIVDFAAEKSAYVKGDTRKFRYFRCDAMLADSFIKKQSIDMVVTDLPYGVQHGSVGKSNGLSRGAADLTADLLPILYAKLKPGGSIVMAFNEFTTKRARLTGLLEESGFTVMDGFDSFRHRVDQAIDRDIVVAVKQ